MIDVTARAMLSRTSDAELRLNNLSDPDQSRLLEENEDSNNKTSGKSVALRRRKPISTGDSVPRARYLMMCVNSLGSLSNNKIMLDQLSLAWIHNDRELLEAMKVSY